MKYYFAPMEGITGYIYRNAHQACFGGMDRYYSPFIAPGVSKDFTFREIQDVCPEHNNTLTLVPQVLTNQAELFVRSAEQLQEMGYEEVNLNLGCPSGTVVAKKKGSGFLAYPDELQAFLDEIFRKSPVPVSIKTRIGRESSEEFGRLLEIYNQYPIKELTIHPRVQKDMYKNQPNWEAFRIAVEKSTNPLCYNGDLFTLEAYREFRACFPQVEAVMLGRGMLKDPGLIQKIRQFDGDGGTPMSWEEETDALLAFHNQIYREYREVLSGDRNLLFKMKEVWFYLAECFPDCEKERKKIKKAEKCVDYERAVEGMFAKRR